MRPMKKYCFLFVFLVAALSLRAQIVGDVAVTRKVLAERDVYKRQGEGRCRGE